MDASSFHVNTDITDKFVPCKISSSQDLFLSARFIPLSPWSGDAILEQLCVQPLDDGQKASSIFPVPVGSDLVLPQEGDDPHNALGEEAVVSRL